MTKQTKECQFCGEEILAVAIKCKHCQSILNNNLEEIDLAETQEVTIDEIDEAETKEIEEAKVIKKQGIPEPPEGMVLVPAGEFLYGEEKEKHYLDAFYIDIYPITNAQYKKFIEATGHRKPEYWNDDIFNQPDQPVVGVSWFDANEYADWAGKRLPSEEEWEKAARGNDGREYPWGNKEPTSILANFGENEGRTTPVNKYPKGKSPYDCYDMGGNVWEWCSDLYDDDKPYRVIRGGSWTDDTYLLRSAYRDGGRPNYGNDFEGFRCARRY